MNGSKKRGLRKRGWTVGNAREFLRLSDDEATLIEIRLSLADAVRRRRAQRGWSQLQLAKHIESSQSRVAKMEAGDPSCSIDLLVRALLALGCSRKDLARSIGPRAA
jgi:ribosome-binding protein aMBF1 (putative translation factor)